MAATHSSSSSARGAMSASLVLVLLLAAVASAQAGTTPVSFENKCGHPAYINGVLVAVNAKVVVACDLKVAVNLQIRLSSGLLHSEKFLLPVDVRACAILYNGVYLKVIVTGVKSILGVVATLLGFVLLKIKIILL